MKETMGISTMLKTLLIAALISGGFGCKMLPGAPTYDDAYIIQNAANVLVASMLYNTTSAKVMDNYAQFQVHCVLNSSQTFNDQPIVVNGAGLATSCSEAFVENTTYIMVLKLDDCPLTLNGTRGGCFRVDRPSVTVPNLFEMTSDNIDTASRVCGFPDVTTITPGYNCPVRSADENNCIKGNIISDANSNAQSMSITFFLFCFACIMTIH